MAECYRCGISDESERLFDAISGKGVVKICKKCANEEDLPLVQPVDLNKPERHQSVYERLSRMANLDPEKHRIKLVELERERSLSRQRGGTSGRREPTLKSVVDANFEKKKSQLRGDLINNYHWILMRMRRAKKLTQKQLAENIGESEIAVRTAEEGKLLNDTDVLVRKLENYFGVKLRKGEGAYSSERADKKALLEKIENGKFDSDATENVTIGDLKEAKEKKEKSGGLFSFFKKSKKEESKNEDEKGLSDEEADEILYGK